MQNLLKKRIVIQKVESLQDPSYPLKEWKKIINNLIKIYSNDAILERDEGHENCGFEIVRYNNEKVVKRQKLSEAFAEIEKHDLKVNTIICTICGCVVNFKNKDSVCIHLKQLAEEFYKDIKEQL